MNWVKVVILSFICIEACADSIDSIQQELQQYWQRPLLTQGEPPIHLSNLETSLEPKSCATCHVTQFQDWNKSLHSHAMGPGVIGQLVDMPAIATKQHQACIRCHAPLQEQAVSLVTSLLENSISNNLHEQGLICAACHMRKYQWHGPPHRNGQPPEDEIIKFPHSGWQSSTIFQSAEFCSACHQFKPEEYALNGKLLENTYEEWKASRYSKEGKTCQTCHMPDRRHLWRGIHDPDMVKQGIEIKNIYFKQHNIITAKLSIKNTGTGHYFPTYVTPRVIIEGYQEDKNGKALLATKQQYIISRKVTMNLSKELADTRLAPDEQVVFNYNAKHHPEAVSFILNVQVEPDHFYTKFYQITLKSAKKGKELLQKALEQSQQSTFSIYFHRQVL